MKTLKTILITVFLAYSLLPIASYADDEATLSEYRIGPENVLQIDVYYGRDRELERKVRVSSDGNITFPLLGEVSAANLTVAELEDKLTSLLEKDYLVNPQVSIFIEEYSTVSILGQVKEPGAYEIKGNISVVELISTAGGFTKIANTNAVRVLRTYPNGDKKTFVVKVNDIINKGRERDDIQLQPGDIVTVPESFF